MKRAVKYLSLPSVLYTSLFFLGLLYVVQSSPVFYPDSYSYLKMDLSRSPGYSCFLALCSFVFGSYFLSAVLVLQYTINFWSVRFFSLSLEKNIHLNKWLSWMLFLVMIHPIFKGVRLAQLILSESLAYPMYLLIFGLLLQGMKTQKKNPFYQAVGIAFILILVRGQFLFVIPVMLLAFLITYYKQWRDAKVFLLFLSIITLPLFTNLTDMGYHKFKHGYSVSTPWTGIQIITMPFFVADKSDAQIFENQTQRQYFNYIYQKLEQKKLLLHQVPKNVKPMDFYYQQYVYICNRTLHRDGVQFFNQPEDMNKKIIANNQITMAMSWALLKDNFSKWKKMYAENFMSGFDTSKYFLLHLFIFVLATYNWFHKKDILSAFIILTVWATILNVALVAAAEAVIQRYTFYNQWILVAIVLLLFQNLIEQKKYD